MAEKIVSSYDLTKVYDTGKATVEALRGVSLSIERGEMISVMGPSGCGKTTLLNCLSGLDDISEGRVEIEGQDIGTMNDNAKSVYRAKHIGFIFQFYNLLPVLSSIENVELPLLLAGRSPSEAKDIAMNVLELVGLREWASHRPAELSGGQRQRVTIARALATEPAIVFADEPTGDLDSKTSQDIMDLMVKLNQEKKITFLLVTHDREIGQRAPRRLIMHDGRITDDERDEGYSYGVASSDEGPSTTGNVTGDDDPDKTSTDGEDETSEE